MVPGLNFGPLRQRCPPNWGVWSAADTALPPVLVQLFHGIFFKALGIHFSREAKERDAP